MTKHPENSTLSVHRAWEDYVSLLLGIAVLFSPWMAGEAVHTGAVTSATLIGLLLVVVAGLEIMRLYRWHEVATLVLGAGLFLSPFLFAYSKMTPLGPLHIALGSVIAILSLLEIWQDWGLSDDQLGAHGG